jgi:hypothetical protein
MWGNVIIQNLDDLTYISQANRLQCPNKQLMDLPYKTQAAQPFENFPTAKSDSKGADQMFARYQLAFIVQVAQLSLFTEENRSIQYIFFIVFIRETRRNVDPSMNNVKFLLFYPLFIFDKTFPAFFSLLPPSPPVFLFRILKLGVLWGICRMTSLAFRHTAD